MRQAEPAVAARWLVRTVAGNASGPARRILAGIAVSLLLLALTAAALVSVLVSLALVGTAFEAIAAPQATPGRPTIAWALVALTSVTLLGAAAAVSWTAARRLREANDSAEAGPNDDGGREAPGPADAAVDPSAPAPREPSPRR